MEPRQKDPRHVTRCLKGSSLIGPESGPPSLVETDGERIIRIRPFPYDWQYDKEKLNPWHFSARGKTFAPPMKSVISFVGLGYKKRVYSQNRVRYPLKRVDFDPSGERNPQNRGKSKYVRISWDEAAQLVADELVRVKEKYGMSAVLSETDLHGEGKHLAPSHGCPNRLLSMLGGYTIQMRNEDSWEGWVWGSKHVWGCEPVGEMSPTANLYPDISENADLLLFWGCDPETTPLGIGAMLATRLCYWLSEIGLKSVYICPDLNFGAAVHADKWIPILPNTDAALQLAIAYMWLTEGTYEKEYIDTHAYGFDKFADYVLGREDGIPKHLLGPAKSAAYPNGRLRRSRAIGPKRQHLYYTVTAAAIYAARIQPNRPAWKTSCWACVQWANPVSTRPKSSNGVCGTIIIRCRTAVSIPREFRISPNWCVRPEKQEKRWPDVTAIPAHWQASLSLNWRNF